MTGASISVRHNFETAHRLPFLGGKCENLHGHSWYCEVTIYGEPSAEGILIDFASAKRTVRDWIDTYFDHGAILGAADPLAEALVEHSPKVFVFDPAEQRGEARYCQGGVGYYDRRPLPWPTVENVAELLRRMVIDLVPGAQIVDVTVTETAVNAATARTPR